MNLLEADEIIDGSIKGNKNFFSSDSSAGKAKIVYGDKIEQHDNGNNVSIKIGKIGKERGLAGSDLFGWLARNTAKIIVGVIIMIIGTIISNFIIQFF